MTGRQVIVPMYAGPGDADTVTSVIVSAFARLPIMRWAVPDPDDRYAVLGRYFRIFVDHALAVGTVLTVPDGNAAALWFPHLDGPPPDIADYDTRLADATGVHADRFRAIDATFDAVHPTGRPHHYCMVVAVPPAQQHRGFGTALMREQLDRADAAGVGTYLEATGAVNAAWYERLGYRHIGGPARPAGGGPALLPMWRDPQPLPAV